MRDKNTHRRQVVSHGGRSTNFHVWLDSARAPDNSTGASVRLSKIVNQREMVQNKQHEHLHRQLRLGL